MANEIIDLTSLGPEEGFSCDSELPVSLVQVQPGADREGRRSRTKKLKKSLVEGNRQSSATQTREHSLEEGELDRHPIQQEYQRLRHESGNVKRKRPASKFLEEEQLTPYPRKTTPSSPQSPGDTADIFFVDVEPAPLPAVCPLVPPTIPDGPGDKLLLPAHVSVFGLAPVQILPTPKVDLNDEDYIEYLDYDERKDLVRYFEHPIDGSSKKPNRVVCKNCGAEGEHRTAACPCLTCGARNEHPTRSCPISKTCFTCGMKGHINATCPNRSSARMADFNKYDDCSRCGSYLHNNNECSTLWRLYEYLADEEQEHTLRTREERRNLSLGEGGEGYIAADKWCYNCGSCGHWGDDCQDVPRRDLPKEPSAFGSHNTLSGPFFDAELPQSTSHYREPREWEHHDRNSAWGNDLPENVGKQGRRKNAERMEQRMKEQEADEDPEDWFGNLRHSRSRGPLQNNEKGHPVGPSRIMSFGKSVQQAGRQLQLPSLADRLGEPVHRSDSHRPAKSRYARTSDEHNRKNRSTRDDGFRQEYRRREEVGPRYKGGYGK